MNESGLSSADTYMESVMSSLAKGGCQDANGQPITQLEPKECAAVFMLMLDVIARRGAPLRQAMLFERGVREYLVLCAGILPLIEADARMRGLDILYLAPDPSRLEAAKRAFQGMAPFTASTDIMYTTWDLLEPCPENQYSPLPLESCWVIGDLDGPDKPLEGRVLDRARTALERVLQDEHRPALLLHREDCGAIVSFPPVFRPRPDHPSACQEERNAATPQPVASGAAHPYRPASKTGTLMEKFLVERAFEDFRRTVPPPPAFPENWKPGFFSSDQPWGSLESATALIAGGKVAEGRELLRRLAKHNASPSARALLAKDLTRPPEDGKLSWQHLMQLPHGSSEFNAIRACRALLGRDYDLGGAFFLTANESRPTSIHGCAFLLQAYLSASDLLFQGRLLVPLKREIEGILVIRPLKGLAQLLERHHEEAWTTFKLGWLEADNTPKAYEDRLKLRMTAEDRSFITESQSRMCAAGLGLILFDLGLRRVAAEIFEALSPALEGMLQIASQELART